MKETIEKQAYRFLIFYNPQKAEYVKKYLFENHTPEEIAQYMGGQNVLMGAIYLLAANYIFETQVKYAQLP